MTRLYLATDDGLVVLSRREGTWQAEVQLQGWPTQCVAIDPRRPQTVYCGTFGRGLMRSDDGGQTWRAACDGIAYAQVTAVAISRTEPGVVWAGTEPSAIFHSADGGSTWAERPNLRTIPSAPTWSFPPRPWTHHVRWIEPDPTQCGRLYVAIELGGVMQSDDDGLTWHDRKPGAKLDAHTLRAHPGAPGRVYEAAGDGYAQTDDAGATWRPEDDGLVWHYLWGMAVDPVDPETVLVSVSPGPRHAHDAHWGDGSWDQEHRGARRAPSADLPGKPPWLGYEWHGPEAWLYRRTDKEPWQAVTTGLPKARGTPAYVLATDESEPGAFYASPWSDAIYRSEDTGKTWERLAIAFPSDYVGRRVHALGTASVV